MVMKNVRHKTNLGAAMMVYALVLGGTNAAEVLAREPQTPSPSVAARASAEESLLVRVEVVLARFQGTNKISSLPYTMLVEVPFKGEGFSSLRTGVSIPTGAESVVTAEGRTTHKPEMQALGTNIDLRGVSLLAKGRYRMMIILSDTALAETAAGAEARGRGLVPQQPGALRQLSLNNIVTVREGVPLEFSVGTDPLTGETTRATVTVRTVE